jgi:hypothetical protein
LHKATLFIRKHPEKVAGLVAKATGLSLEITTKALSLHDFDLKLDETVREGLEKTGQVSL